MAEQSELFLHYGYTVNQNCHFNTITLFLSFGIPHKHHPVTMTIS